MRRKREHAQRSAVEWKRNARLLAHRMRVSFPRGSRLSRAIACFSRAATSKQQGGLLIVYRCRDGR